MASDDSRRISRSVEALQCLVEPFQTRRTATTEKGAPFGPLAGESSSQRPPESTGKRRQIHQAEDGNVTNSSYPITNPAHDVTAESRGQRATHPITDNNALETLVRTAVQTLVTSPLLVGSAPQAALTAANENMAKVVGLEEVVSVVNETADPATPVQASGPSQAGPSNELRSGLNMIFGDIDSSAEKQSNRVLIVNQQSASMVHGLGAVEERLEFEGEGQSLGARKRKPTQPLSPEGPTTKQKRKKKPGSSRGPRSTGQPFKCDLCGSPYVINPSRRGNRLKTSTHNPSPRHKFDPRTGNTLTLCNACGLSYDRPKKPRKEKYVASPEEKKKYLDEASQFAQSLVDGLGDPDAGRLCCPHFKLRACGCLQSYIIGDGTDMNASRQRATDMLALLKEAKELGSQKCYDAEVKEALEKNKRAKSIGLGNGQRKSQSFEDFILTKRKYLRDELKLCERATQRVLIYSNNFLHKKLKTDPDKPIRVERQKGKAALGKLRVIEELPKERCCVDNCVMIAVSHAKLLHQWRDRAVSGQMEARRVLAEMLTPSGGARSNCYKFISWVTGCSHSTIGRVNEQMKQTGGDREPPEHGLIRWWREHPKPKKVKVKSQQALPAVAQTETVQQVALQQIQQVMPQVTNILQAAVSSAGLAAVMMPPAASSTAVPLTTINTSQLAQTQLVPTVTLTNGSSQAQQSAPQQIQIQAVTPAPVQTQQQQFQQQIQQLQLQQLQLQQAQQQIQQQIQQAQAQQQQLQAQASQQLQPQQQQQQVQVQTPQQPTTQALQSPLSTVPPQDQAAHAQQQQQPETQQTTGTITITTTGDQVVQTSPLNTETFLTADTFHLLNVVQPGQVVTIPVTPQASAITHSVPVSLIQTSTSAQGQVE